MRIPLPPAKAKWYEIGMNWVFHLDTKQFGLATQTKRVQAMRLVRKEIHTDSNLSETSGRRVASAAQNYTFLSHG